VKSDGEILKSVFAMRLDQLYNIENSGVGISLKHRQFYSIIKTIHHGKVNDHLGKVLFEFEKSYLHELPH
jgi:hypothetical protein